MWTAWVRWIRRLFRREPVTALEAINAIHAEKRPRADPAEWAKLRGNFASRVFSERDRERLWRRHQRRFEHAASDWEPSAPTSADVDCLTDLLRDLER